jgi:hypothetical protein
MSYDRQIDQVCPHTVKEEAVFVGSDRQTIRPIKPVSSGVGLTVRLNSQVDVPSFGVSLPATITSQAGPFVIPSGCVLEVSLDQGSTRSFPIPSGRQSATTLARALGRQTNLLVFSDDKSRLTITTTSVESSASVYFTAGSSLNPIVGIPSPREYRGVDLYPPWSLVYDPSTLSDRPTRLIVFDRPLRSASDYAEISYTTLRQDCRRCGGAGVENDWRYGTTGEVVQVRDEALLIQELQKLFVTVRGSNRFHPQYGTGLIESVGKKLVLQGFAQNLIVNDLYESFSRWQEIKRKQEEQVGQEVTDAEFPFRLLRATVAQNQDDPTVINVSLTIQSRSRKTLQIERGLKVPASIKDFQAGVIRNSLRGPSLVG